jgi:hypothetical protein
MTSRNTVNVRKTSKAHLDSSNQHGHSEITEKFMFSRSESITSRSATKIKEFSRRLTAPTKSSEMKFIHCKKTDLGNSKKLEQKEINSSQSDENSEEDSESMDTPNISFHASENSQGSNTHNGADTTPVISASVDMYEKCDRDNLIENMNYDSPQSFRKSYIIPPALKETATFNSLKHSQFTKEDYNTVRKINKTISGDLTSRPNSEVGKPMSEDYMKSGYHHKNKTNLTSTDYYKLDDEKDSKLKSSDKVSKCTKKFKKRMVLYGTLDGKSPGKLVNEIKKDLY